MPNAAPLADLQATFALLAKSDKLDRERLLGRWAEKHLETLQSALAADTGGQAGSAQDANRKALDYLHPLLDAGTFGAPSWAIDLASILTGGERLTPADDSALPTINIRCETRDGDVTATTSLGVVRVEQEDDGSVTAVTDHWPTFGAAAAPVRCGTERHELDAYLWKRESTNEWVLELSGTINDTAFIVRHAEPAATAPETAVGLPGLYARMESADRWDALLGSARIRVLGSAGLHTARTPYGEDWNGYAHIGLELWTVHEAGCEPPDAVAQLTRYVDVMRGIPTPAQLAQPLHPQSNTDGAAGQVTP